MGGSGIGSGGGGSGQYLIDGGSVVVCSSGYTRC